ncbi:thiamine-phosphate kinase [Cohnella pontilimi]|uniref:Thiamine-monophosphate kinase n=1 Tax=Cohnella pontilimi TaxID=2564100 RepID=A0A4U0FCU8_9BACL|nr:thiamine-phosphate kinase [Cohnella pontilimi]TJY42726.1 thiamine-phosphate kinase [Cohnella pontilimi]
MPLPDEFERIRLWTESRQTADFLLASGVRLGIGDDTAVVGAPAGIEWLLAVDTMVEQIHFRSETMEDADVGYKALASNISDIAAMGGIPAHALISVSVPPAWDFNRMKSLYDGFYECAERYSVAVVGGDTTAAPSDLVVAVTVFGTVEAGRAITRAGARAGHIVFVTGPVGLSAGGLHGMLPSDTARPKPPERLIRAHRRPAPSVKAGRLLLERGWGKSLNDVSDGLASEAWEIAEASGVRLVLKEASLPLSGELASYAADCRVDPLDWMLYGGEDYVLLGTANGEDEAAMREVFRQEGIPLFVIGETEEGPPGVELETERGLRKPLAKRGYNHFAKG